MSEYNAKNYTEQGGDVTHIGGVLQFEEGGKLKGGLMPNQAQEIPGSDNVAKVRASLNGVIAKIKNAGLMVGDAFNVTVNHSVNDTVPSHADRTYNTGKISDVSYADGVITITLSDKVKNLKDFDGGNGWGVHKWLGIGVSAGVTPITALTFNGTELTDEDIAEAIGVGLSEGYFVLWVKAEKIIQGESNTFKLWAYAYEETEFTLVIVEPE